MPLKADSLNNELSSVQAEMDTFWYLKRFFYAFDTVVSDFPVDVSINDSFAVDHIRKVLRYKGGEFVCVVDGKRAIAYEGELKAIERNHVVVSLKQRLPLELENDLPKVTLGAALIKEQRWDTLLQKTTELGCTEIVPLAASRCVVKLDTRQEDKKQARWQHIVRSAAQQSEGLTLPEIQTQQLITDFCETTKTEPHRFILLERGDTRPPLRDVLETIKSSTNVMPEKLVAVLGPEGGWTDAEIEQFLDAGFQGVSLGNRVLRSETAAMAFMASIVYAFDGWPKSR